MIKTKIAKVIKYFCECWENTKIFPTIQIKIDVSYDKFTRIQELKDKLNVDNVELFNRAITLLKYYVDAEDNGEFLAIVNEDQKTYKEISFATQEWGKDDLT